MRKYDWAAPLLSLTLLAFLLVACNGMEDQPKYEPLDPSSFFENGMSARSPVANTVARGQLQADSLLYDGQENGAPATEFPFPVTDEVLARGQERYNIFCTACHGYSGYGDGVVVGRGLTHPPSFHSERLRTAPVGHIFDVISHGFGAMYSYGDRIPVEDRWAIIAYVRALQLSQNATLEDVPPEVRPTLEAETKVVTETMSEDESQE
jgi:mono/diheme cytochrome c family protein